MAMKSQDFNYIIPYKLSETESLFNLATKTFALHLTSNLLMAKFLPQHVKTILIELLGRRSLLTGPVLRLLAHKDLQSIYLAGALARDSTVKILQYLTKLKSLHIPGHEISTRGLLNLFPCLPFLEEVDVSCSTQVDDQVLVSLTDNCPKLHLINMRKCTNFTNKGFQYLAENMVNVSVLDISYTMVTDEAMQALYEGPSRLRLREVHIDGCHQLSSKYSKSTA